MNRFGFNDIETIEKVFKFCEKTQNISICSVFTHYYNAKCEKSAESQFLKFLKIKDFVGSNFYKNDIIFHIANSDGLALKNKLDMVRVGIKTYTDKMFQTVTLKSKIIEFQNLEVGDTAGYSSVFRASYKTKLAVVAIGYADGIFRNIVGRGYVLIKGNFAKIVAVCMDSILVDVTNINCKLYDDAVLIGKSEDKQIFVCDVARWCDTIDYEILTKISKRVKRKYIF